MYIEDMWAMFFDHPILFLQHMCTREHGPFIQTPLSCGSGLVMDSHGCESRQGPPTITHNDPQPSSTTEHSIVSSSPTVLPSTDNPCGPSVNMSFPGIYVITKFHDFIRHLRRIGRSHER